MDGTTRGAGVRERIEDPHNTCVTSAVTLAEVVSKFIRKGRDPKLAARAIEDNSSVQAVDLTMARLAGEVHAETKRKVRDFGLADAFVLAAARNRGFKVLTGDPHFETIPESVMI